MNEVCQYYGKYRGTVVNNIDPEQRGRLLVTVPDVLGVNLSSWAMPCLPLAGSNMGIYTVPPVGAGVWIEFEQGDPDYPVWVGCFWGTAAEVPGAGAKRPPDSAGDHPANGHPERHCDQRCSRANRGHSDPDRQRRRHHDHRCRHFPDQREGRHDQPEREDR